MYDYYDLSNLPRLDLRRQTLQVASFDKKEDNADFGQFLYQDKDGAMVLFDEKGKGCIRSIWSAIVTEETHLAFYFDGSDTPRYETTLMGLFTDTVPEISGAGNTFEERGNFSEADCRAGNCFVPIPYENGLKITATGKLDFYYHIMYEKYTDDVDMSTVPGQTSALRAAFAGERAVPAGEVIEKEIVLDKKYTQACLLETPGVITEFTVIADPDLDLSPVKLDVSWDGDRISQMATPLLYLFAQPFGYTPVNSTAVHTRMENGKAVYSCYLPMPFWSRANIELVQFDGVERHLTLRLRVAENTYDVRETGHLYADYRQGSTALFDDWQFAAFPGRGHAVGFVQTCIGDQYCEGNEHFRLNGARSPQLNGTGTEDFYLGCYWPNKKYDSPCGGCVNDVFLMGGSTLPGAFLHPSGYYRYLLDMPIAFLDGADLQIQHGAVGQTYSEYTSLCLSYRQPESAFCKTDHINVSSAASRTLHSYTSGGEAETLSAKLEGDRKAPHLTKTGLVHNGGKIAFDVAILPENEGVCLRRLYDQRMSPQCGNLTVDGVPAGAWYNPNFNDYAPFADSELYLPVSLTRGKEMLHIEIDVSEQFSDFEYQVFSIVK